MHEEVRLPAVAGAFYPASPSTLDALVTRLLADARAESADASSSLAALPKAIIVPHAGYVYSGAVAARAFALLSTHAERISRVVLLGPAHRLRVDGLASPGATHLRTPLGDVTVDAAGLAGLARVPESPEAHRREHSLEVELPFLQKVAPRAKVVPLVVGAASAEEVARVLGSLWGGPETVIVVSSDLSHYLPYDVGREKDRRTAARITSLDGPLSGEEACGARGINGLLLAAAQRHMRASLVDLRSSGDTAGPRDEVVGYGAFALYEEGP
jgi:AmmeMemoRadiSam system protein B